MSNGDAGIIIGQRGSNVVAIQEGTGCSVKISQSGTYFPGTMQRVVLVAGPVDSVVGGIAAVLAILEQEEARVPPNTTIAT